MSCSRLGRTTCERASVAASAPVRTGMAPGARICPKCGWYLSRQGECRRPGCGTVVAPDGMRDGAVDRGPSGNPDRIDFGQLGDGRVNVVKMRRDAPNRRDVSTGHEIKHAGFDLDAALAWCEESGYTVRRWQGGARAWKGKPWVIRTRAQIERMRERNTLRAMGGRGTGTSLSLDFAYDG